MFISFISFMFFSCNEELSCPYQLFLPKQREYLLDLKCFRIFFTKLRMSITWTELQWTWHPIKLQLQFFHIQEQQTSGLEQKQTQPMRINKFSLSFMRYQIQLCNLFTHKKNFVESLKWKTVNGREIRHEMIFF